MCAQIRCLERILLDLCLAQGKNSAVLSLSMKHCTRLSTSVSRKVIVFFQTTVCIAVGDIMCHSLRFPACLYVTFCLTLEALGSL